MKIKYTGELDSADISRDRKMSVEPSCRLCHKWHFLLSNSPQPAFFGRYWGMFCVLKSQRATRGEEKHIISKELCYVPVTWISSDIHILKTFCLPLNMQIITDNGIKIVSYWSIKVKRFLVGLIGSKYRLRRVKYNKQTHLGAEKMLAELRSVGYNIKG